ncbi:hypothetical protein IPJ70_01215 [Candidatus Campbellbacteria bacterium]|nr:MAG: hypothetical protein IPJ70_01215 [Candidatus Campbellbacteria bacterium]
MIFFQKIQKPLIILLPLVVLVVAIFVYKQRNKNDTEAWIYRGMSFYEEGKCTEAVAALYHASANGDKFADRLLSSVLNSEVCSKQ